jgi:hypothetical protein
MTSSGVPPTGQSVAMRRCATCGYVCREAGEFHPYVFCVLVKAGQDPWERTQELRRVLRDVGPRAAHPPLVRDLPREEPEL